MERLHRRRRSAADDVAEAVLMAIRQGEYKIGDRLPTEPELARQLGVGRTTVREGIRQHRIVGVVEVRRGLGTFVTGLDRDPNSAFLHWTRENRYQIVSLFEVRMSLEGTAASLAAQRADAKDIEAMHHAANAHREAHLAHDLVRLVETDQQFHDTLLLASQNEALYDVYSLLVPRLLEYRRRSLALKGAPERSSHDHLSIVEAVRHRNPQEARAATLTHLTVLYREVLQAGADPTHGGADVPWL